MPRDYFDVTAYSMHIYALRRRKRKLNKSSLDCRRSTFFFSHFYTRARVHFIIKYREKASRRQNKEKNSIFIL